MRSGCPNGTPRDRQKRRDVSSSDARQRTTRSNDRTTRDTRAETLYDATPAVQSHPAVVALQRPRPAAGCRGLMDGRTHLDNFPAGGAGAKPTEISTPPLCADEKGWSMADDRGRFEVRVTADSHFAWLRTRLAVERTLMSWLRTAVALIGFGFTIVQFL